MTSQQSHYESIMREQRCLFQALCGELVLVLNDEDPWRVSGVYKYVVSAPFHPSKLPGALRMQSLEKAMPMRRTLFVSGILTLLLSHFSPVRPF